MVSTVFSSASKARKLHALTARLSTNTVQAPHTSDSQERFVPVRWRRLRRNSSKVSSIGTSPHQGSPFTVTDSLNLLKVSIRLFLPEFATFPQHHRDTPVPARRRA